MMIHKQQHLFEFNELQIQYHTKQLGPKVTSSRDIFEFLVDRWDNIEYCEKFYVVLFNRSNNILGVAFISEGSVSGTVADPKKIFQQALLANASAIAICHNHPSGNLLPSELDKKVTMKCVEAGKLLDLPVMDHIILTKESYFSFADEGVL